MPRVAAFVASLLLTLTGIGGHATSANAAVACTLILPSRSGWAVDMCTDPAVAATMKVSVDGVAKGSASLVRIYQDTDNHTRQPNVMALYASSYVRLKQGADPTPPIPFGASWVLSEAFWPSATEYRANATLTSLSVITQGLPASLRMLASGRNGNLASSYDMTVLEPTDQRTTLVVNRRTTALANVGIDAARAQGGEGYKTLAGASTMHITDTGPCPGGYTYCHDADRARLVASDGTLREVRFSAVPRPGFLFPAPVPIGGRWIDVRHTYATSWQGGDPPSLRVCLDTLPSGRTYRAQGYIAATTNVNDDNVGGPWLHDDWRAQVGWRAGESETVRYRLVAQNDFTATSPTAC